MSKLSDRVTALEQHVQRLLSRADADDYPGRAVIEDKHLGRRVDRLGREESVCPVLLFDDIGAAADRAPKDAQYLVAAADSTLTAERVATNTASITWDFGTAAQAKANVAFGTSSTTACVGNDPRLSDSRTPTSHATSHRPAGSDPIYASEAYTVTNPNTRRSFDTTTVSLPQLAEVVGTMLADKGANKEPVA